MHALNFAVGRPSSPRVSRWTLGHLVTLLCLACCASAPAGVTVEKMISREDPAIEVTGNALNLGRDGKVYMARGNYVLRFEADGTGKTGGKAGWANTAAAVNKDGVIALASAHMSRTVRLLTPEFEEFAKVGGFEANDILGWSAPCDVQTGPSGEFYAADQHNQRLLRIAANGKTLGEHSLKGLEQDFKGRALRFRVVESLKRFYIATEDGNLHAMGFDGNKLWTIAAGIGGNRWIDYAGDFNADDEGNIYILRQMTDTIEVLDSDGKARDKIKLDMGDRTGEDLRFRLNADRVYVKRQHKTEMFQIYDRKTGKFQKAIHADVEYARMEYPSEVWTAGEPMAFSMTLESPIGKITPNWAIRMARYNDYEWFTLPVVDGKVTPPADAAGLYVMRVGYGEFVLENVVEIRKAASRGTLNVLTPSNRAYYGRGEEIPVTVILRGGDDADRAKVSLVLTDRADGAEALRLAADTIKWDGKTGIVTLPVQTSVKLRAGRYMLTSSVEGLTVVPQPLTIGNGLRQISPFHVVKGGDGAMPLADGGLFDGPAEVAVQTDRMRKLGPNLMLDRVGGDVDIYRPPVGCEEVAARLKNDPLGVAPEKAMVENTNLHAIAARGAFGMQQHGILFHMDTVVPMLADNETSPGGMLAHYKVSGGTGGVKAGSAAMLPYPAFRGWSWACNWWINTDYIFKRNGVDRAQFKAMRDKIRENGQWDPEFERMSNFLVDTIPQTDRLLNEALQSVAPGKINAVPGPYRQPGVIPHLSYKNAAEVDLFLQAEQIQMPFNSHHNVDFYTRPGKRAFGHVELHNEDGTGAMAMATVLAQAMRGVDGTGWEGNLIGRPGFDNDARSTLQGSPSTHRTLSELLHRYGPWLTTLKNSDHVAIVVSTRMMRLDDWDGHIGGGYFTRLYEAYHACMYAHRPASYIFEPEATAETLKKYKAVLVVGQRVELESSIAAALKDAQAAGVSVYYDGTCRTEHVEGFTPLNITFDRVEKDPHLMNDDSVYYRAPKYFKEHGKALDKVLGSAVPTVAGLDNPEILLSERRNGEGRFVWALNNDLSDWEPGYMWRVSMFVAHRVGQILPINLRADGQVVYDVFAMKQQQGANVLDLRRAPARLFAILPKPIKSVSLTAPDAIEAGGELAWKVAIDGPNISYPISVRLIDANGEVIEKFNPVQTSGSITVPLRVGPTLTLETVELISGKRAVQKIRVTSGSVEQAAADAPALAPVETFFGPHLRELVVSPDGSTALINAMDWDDNFYLVSTKDGSVRTQGHIGHHYAYAPLSTGKGFLLQGYDLTTAEGYHLYDLGADGKPARRFAIFGVPQRGTRWYGGPEIIDRINSFAAAPDGQWVANGSSMGLIVWNRDGKKLWSQDWLQDTRKIMVLLAGGNDTLITLQRMTVTAYEATTGHKLWEQTLDKNGVLQGGHASADGKTLVVFSDNDGTYNSPDLGQTFVLRDGKVIRQWFVQPQNAALTPDGRHVLMNLNRELTCYAVEGDGLAAWVFKGDDALRSVRISPDGKKIVVSSDLGTLYVLDDQGKVLLDRDFGSLPVARWLDGGDLLVATWKGEVVRMGADGAVKWRSQMDSKSPTRLSQPIVGDKVATVRADWAKAQKAGPLTPNLLAETKAVISVGGGVLKDGAMLYDGKTDPPAEPWFSWTAVGIVDSGWVSKVPLQVDTADVTMRVTGITIVEDPKNPQSWMRDAIIQVWDPVKGVWVDGQWLPSDSVSHTHWFAKPLEGARFRFIGDKAPEHPGTGIGWPAGNLRMAELVFHGSIVKKE